jgi:general secretion pathway protein B
MSYILDALKKAESDRQLGSIPNIYAAAPPQAAAGASSERPKWLPWIVALNLLAAAVAAALWFNARPVVAPAASVPKALAAAPTIAAAPIIAQTVVPAARSFATPAPPSVPASIVTSKSDAGQTRVPESVAPAMRATTMEKPQVLTPAQSPSEEKPVGSLRDLPENLQREIPAATVNGYIYAKNPADRSVLINNKLLHEGEQVEPGLVLDKLTPNGAVLNFKGYQYRIPY